MFFISLVSYLRYTNMAKYQSHPLRETVSKRCDNVFYEEFYMDVMQRSLPNEYNEETNTQGFIDLGTAMNCLCEDMIEEHINSSHLLKYSKANQHYDPDEGKRELREAVAAFITKHFNAKSQVDAEQVVITNGVTGAVDFLAHILADPGDIFLCFGPSCSRSFHNTWERSQVHTHVIPLLPKREAEKEAWEMNAKDLEDGIMQCQKEGKSVKALVLLNPHDPIGSVLSVSALSAILEVCKRYVVHVIADESYGLSVWDESSKFVSVLSLDTIPDPNRTHVLWGISKDLGLTGCRIGALCTLNPCVLHCLKRLCNFNIASSVTQDFVTRLINDNEWLDSYFKDCHTRTKEAFEWTRTRLEDMGLKVHPARAGFFIWADFGRFLKTKTVYEEMAFFERLMEYTKVAVVPGHIMFCREPGWCRIIYTVPRKRLETALSRIETFLTNTM